MGIRSQRSGGTRDAAASSSNIAFYSMVPSNLRAQDMKELLASRGLEPVGAKTMLAQLIVNQLTEGDVEEFVVARSKRPRVDATSESGRQCTLDGKLAGAGRGA